MPRFRSETASIEITYTTDGEVINRITGSRSDPKMTKEVLIAYLEQFCGVKIQPVDKGALTEDINDVIRKHLSYDREAN